MFFIDLYIILFSKIIEETYMKVLVMGLPGSGKTYLTED